MEIYAKSRSEVPEEGYSSLASPNLTGGHPFSTVLIVPDRRKKG